MAPSRTFFKKLQKIKKSRNSPLKGISTFIFHCTFKTTYMLHPNGIILPLRESGSYFATAFLISWSSPHPISNSQLHVLPHFHLCPIYLVVFKGSY